MSENIAKTSNSLEQADARRILNHALESVFPETALRRYVSFDKATHVLTVAGEKYDLDHYEKIFVVGGGRQEDVPAQNW